LGRFTAGVRPEGTGFFGLADCGHLYSRHVKLGSLHYFGYGCTFFPRRGFLRRGRSLLLCCCNPRALFPGPGFLGGAHRFTTGAALTASPLGTQRARGSFLCSAQLIFPHARNRFCSSLFNSSFPPFFAGTQFFLPTAGGPPQVFSPQLWGATRFLPHLFTLFEPALSRDSSPLCGSCAVLRPPNCSGGPCRGATSWSCSQHFPGGSFPPLLRSRGTLVVTPAGHHFFLRGAGVYSLLTRRARSLLTSFPLNGGPHTLLSSIWGRGHFFGGALLAALGRTRPFFPAPRCPVSRNACPPPPGKTSFLRGARV